MPRRSQGPRLYLDPRRKQWVIRDGEAFIRTGCPTGDNESAEKQLADYIASKYKPKASPAPLIDDVLIYYAASHLPDTAAKAKAAHNISNLSKFWSGKQSGQVNADNCKAYAKDRPKAAARRDLEVLRAALLYWNKNKMALNRVPVVVLPEKSGPRERWLTREEAKRLRLAAMRQPHVYRFVMLGLKTGSRSEVMLTLKWSQIDLEHGVMTRKAEGAIERANKKRPPVRLGRSFVRLLRRWKRQDDKAGIEYVVHYHGERIEKLRRSWATVRSDAKLGPDVTPHTLRHTRATWLMQAGIDPWEAAGSLGMSLRVLETVYGKHSPDYQANAAEV